MSRRIYKYQINPSTILLLPVGSKCIHIGAQGANVYMWAEVWTDMSPLVTEEWRMFIIGTGHELLEGMDYEHLGTAMIDPFVWHVYRVMS